MEKRMKIIKDHLSRNAYLTVKQASDLGIGRHVLSNYVKTGDLVRVERGIYNLPNEWNDEFELLQKKNKNVIFSHGTALYFLGLSDRTPHMIHITVSQGYNAHHLKNEPLEIRVHYVKKENVDIGAITIRSPQGGNIKIYDPERCICDIIRDKKYTDIQIFQDAIKRYFSLKDKDLRKLLKYSRIFKVEDEVRKYIEVLT